MHFLGEACYRRPLEPKLLAYSRGSTAITMCLLFLAFCGYLISQIYYDHPLIQASSEQIVTDIQTPDVEICAQNTTISVVKCSAMYYNWTFVDIPDCWNNFFVSGINGETSKCYLFRTNNAYRMATGLSYDSRNALRRLDFYWNIDSLYNLTYSTISIPAVAVQLYDPHFSTWAPETVGNTPVEKEKITNIQLGSSRATSFFNHTSSIFYHVEKYRAIKPHDAASIFGLQPNYVDIYTLVNSQHDWPLQNNPPPPAFNRSLYHGVFSVQLAQSSIEIKTEIRQHTVLAAVALAGGCYGLLTTMYILLFGMSRLTPWGIVHHIPTYFSKHKSRYIENNTNDEDTGQGSQHAISDQTNNKYTIYVPWFFRARLNGKKTHTVRTKGDTFIRKMMACKSSDDNIQEKFPLDVLDNSVKGNQSESAYSPDVLLLHSNHPGERTSTLSDDSESVDYMLSSQSKAGNHNTSSPSLPPNTTSPLGIYHDPVSIINALHEEQKKSSELSNRVEELEVILREYFINTTYLDEIRSRRNITLLPAHEDKSHN